MICNDCKAECMTRKEAVEILIDQRDNDVFVSDWRNTIHKALNMAIADMLKMQYLTGRPCEVCSCRNENGCGVWNCVFDGKENL